MVILEKYNLRRFKHGAARLNLVKLGAKAPMFKIGLGPLSLAPKSGGLSTQFLQQLLNTKRSNWS
jgi:hypothetical protein